MRQLGDLVLGYKQVEPVSGPKLVIRVGDAWRFAVRGEHREPNSIVVWAMQFTSAVGACLERKNWCADAADENSGIALRQVG